MPVYLQVHYGSLRLGPAHYLRFRFQVLTASRAATLLEAIRMGMLLWDPTKKGGVAVGASWLVTAVDPAAFGLLRSSAALTVKQYRKQLAKERKKGKHAHRRYTFTGRPLIEVADGEYIVLRPAWVLDRFCRSMLYWQAIFEFGRG